MILSLSSDLDGALIGTGELKALSFAPAAAKWPDPEIPRRYHMASVAPTLFTVRGFCGLTGGDQSGVGLGPIALRGIHPADG
ncbi:MAG: hypothetical protein ABSA46_02110 [Thermodesulfovibrionales bacterium]|jgi:hypothetical protein